MSQFNWQTEDEQNWSDSVPRATPTAVLRRRRWLRAGIILIIVAGGLLVIYRQVTQRIAEAVAQAESDVTAVHSLTQYAGLRADADLLAPLLSRSESEWAATQKKLAAESLLLDRPGFGLTVLLDKPITAAPDLVLTDTLTITLSVDLNTAELQQLQTYQFQQADGLTRTVALVQTAVYQRRNNRWLWSPLSNEFWGSRNLTEKGHIHLTYPKRDETIALRLLSDLNRIVEQTCRDVAGLDCPATYQLDLVLATDPALLANLDGLAPALNDRPEALWLPTPSLIGIPLDETGYDALLPGYGRYVAAFIINEQLGFGCCKQSNAPVQTALLEKQLAHLNLQAWPLTPDAYELLLNVSLDFLNDYLRQDIAEADKSLATLGVMPYALVEFLEVGFESPHNLASLQRNLIRETDYWTWLVRYRVLGNRTTGGFLAEWQRYIYEQSRSGQVPAPPVNKPDESLMLLCRLPDNSGNIGYRYDSDEDRWWELFRLNGMEQRPVLPGKGTYLGAKNRSSPSFLWPDDEAWFVLNLTEDQIANGLVFSGAVDPQNRYAEIVGPPAGEASNHNAIDIRACVEEGLCEPQLLTAWPLWSPDRQVTLLNDLLDTSSLFLADATGKNEQFVAEGYAPLWLNDGFYAFQVKTDTGWELRIANITAERPSALFTSEDLRTLLSVNEPYELPKLTFIGVSPSSVARSADWIGVIEVTSLETGLVNYVFHMETNAAFSEVRNMVLLDARPHFPLEVAFSPNGRFLLMRQTLSRSTYQYQVWDMNQITSVKTVDPLFTLDDSEQQAVIWSPDGQWLLLRNNRFMRFVHIETGYQDWEYTSFLGNCYDWYWLE